MPPVNTQGSRGGLIATIVIFVVLWLVTSFAADPASAEGPGDELVDLATVAPQTGVEPVVVVLGSSGDRWDVTQLRRLGVPVVELGLAPWDPRSVRRTVRALRNFTRASK